MVSNNFPDMLMKFVCVKNGWCLAYVASSVNKVVETNIGLPVCASAIVFLWWVTALSQQHYEKHQRILDDLADTSLQPRVHYLTIRATVGLYKNNISLLTNGEDSLYDCSQSEKKNVQ